ncbi:hypothetical protein BST81_06500 [Leptolyngbya sp. 'hensonii']|uniref:VapE domain-containing protein n=1 Tax=Leptolyngbya sp. 'hensonii' TaxID=1922337 RepID=UPI00094F4E72|nr:VapE domain-containing protein [Leptolyngbya sp. 'hensonii']OLP19390.1 hypothetical protein BST81_06500 [Leptolyngbya sp. 'hensonii']
MIVGTTNQPQFRANSTGNHRFWVIPVAQFIDRAMLQKEGDLIWATAVMLYLAGEPWYLSNDEETAVKDDRE